MDFHWHCKKCHNKQMSCQPGSSVFPNANVLFFLSVAMTHRQYISFWRAVRCPHPHVWTTPPPSVSLNGLAKFHVGKEACVSVPRPHSRVRYIFPRGFHPDNNHNILLPRGRRGRERQRSAWLEPPAAMSCLCGGE